LTVTSGSLIVAGTADRARLTPVAARLAAGCRTTDAALATGVVTVFEFVAAPPAALPPCAAPP
jgi:hypothetical protein